MKVQLTIFLTFFLTLFSFSQTLTTQNSNYCDDDSVELIFTTSSSYNSIQWQMNEGVNWINISTSTIYSGVNNDTLLINSVDTSFNTVSFRAILDTGLVGGFEDTTNSYGFFVYGDFLIGSLSGNETICYNTIPSLLSSPSVSGGEGSYTYQWYKDGNALSGATNSTYQPSALTSSSTYSVEVSDLCGTLMSNSINITVLPDLTIGSLLGSQTICYGEIPSLLSSPSVSGGEGSYTYQWYKDGNALSGATNSTYQPSALTSSSTYSVEVSDLCGTLMSNSINITVLPDLTIGSLLGSQTICYGEIPSLLSSPSVSGGEGSYSYQWFMDGSPISGATNDSYQSGPLFTATQFSLELSDACGIIETNAISVLVYPDLNSGTISEVQSICYNTVPSVLSFSTPSSGGQGGHTYQWQSSTDGINWSDEFSANNTSFIPSSLLQTTLYRVQVTDSCEVEYTNEITVLVYDDFAIGSLSGDETICFNTIPSLLLSPSVSGGEGSYTYQWYKDGNALSGATNSTYQPSALTSSSTYSVEVSDLCGTFMSNSILITVLEDVSAGTIVGDTTICYNTSPSTLLMSLSPSGGYNSLYTYQWQSSDDAINWTNLAENSNSLDLGPLTSSKYYRIEVYSDDCGPRYTNNVLINVQEPFTSGSLLNQSICYDTQTSISYQQPPTGGFESYSYQWQLSNDGISWTNVGTNQDFYNTTNHSSSVFYQVIVTDICGDLASNSSLINVYDSLQAGSIITNDTICYGDVLNPIDANFIEPVGGNSIYTYEWNISNDGLNFTTLTSTNSVLNTGSLQDTSYFYVDYTSGNNCGTVSSNILEAIVFPELMPGAIVGDTSICFNTSPDILEMISLPSGGGDLFFNYQWQSSVDEQNWTDIDFANATSHQSSELITSTYFRVKVTSGQWNCGPKFTNSIFVEVYDEFNSGDLLVPATICYNTTPDAIVFDELPSGADGQFSFSWEVLDGSNWVVLNEFSNSFQPNALSVATDYRVLVTSTYGCGSDFNEIVVNVYDSLIAGQIEGDGVICYNEVPNNLSMLSNATGGGDDYSLAWFESYDQQNWSSLEVFVTDYQPETLFDTAYYYMQYISNLSCGTVNSNILTITVNPLPDTVNILGPTSVCGNSSGVEYNLSYDTNNNSYNWSLNSGTFVGSSEVDFAVINFDSSPQSDILFLEQTIDATGCSNVMSLNIDVTSELALDQGIVINKPNTTMLITSDSTLGISYDWGYTDILTGAETVIVDSLRYAIMPHLNTELYWYWVDTYLNNSCITRSYYNGPPIPTSLYEYLFELSIYPNPTHDRIFIEVENLNLVEIYNLHGQMVHRGISNEVDLGNLDNGMYVVRVHAQNKVLTSKILKK